jgi:hypothetical protein
MHVRYAAAVTTPAPTYEYRHATWAEVCDLGPQGWRLVAIPPIVEMKQLLGQMQAGEPLYAMERETRGGGRQVVSSGMVLDR